MKWTDKNEKVEITKDEYDILKQKADAYDAWSSFLKHQKRLYKEDSDREQYEDDRK